MILKKISLLFVLSFLSSTSFALGLGYAKVNSFINQPLDAKIDLQHLGQVAPEDIKVYLATARDFQRFGIDKTLFLRKVVFKVVYSNGQNAHISVTTKKPIKEPLVDFVITIQWPEGNITRDYSLFLNPNPTISKVSKPTLNKNIRKSARLSAKRTGVDRMQQQDEVVYDYSDQKLGNYGPITDGDSISMIAKKIRPDDSYSIQRIMRAIHSMNPDAFIDGEIDRLKMGVMLNIPPLARSEFKKTGYPFTPPKAVSSQQFGQKEDARLSPKPAKITTPKPFDREQTEESQDDSELRLLSSGEKQELSMLDIENPTQEDIDSVSNELIKLTLERVKRLKEENLALRFELLVGRMEEAVEKNARLDEQLAALQSSNQALADGDDILQEVDADMENTISAALNDDSQSEKASPALLSKETVKPISQQSQDEIKAARGDSKTAEVDTKIDTKTAAVKDLPKVAVKSEVKAPVSKADEGMLDSIMKWIAEYLSIWYLIFPLLIGLVSYGYKVIWPKYRHKMGIMDKFSIYKKYSGGKVSADDDIDDIDLDLFEAKPEEKKETATKAVEPTIGSDTEEEIEELTATSAGLLSAQEESVDELDDIFGDTADDFAEEEDSGSSVQSSVLPSDSQINFNDILGSGSSSSEAKSDSDVDIISQCSVYFAYGKFDLAEQLILDGLETEPDSKKYKLKLMECYAKMDNEENFLSYLSKCSDLYSGDEEFRDKVQKMYKDRWKKELY